MGEGESARFYNLSLAERLEKIGQQGGLTAEELAVLSGATENLAPFLGGWHFGIPVNAKAPVAAGEFIRFMASPEIQKERAMRGGPLSSSAALSPSPSAPPARRTAGPPAGGPSGPVSPPARPSS